MRRTVLFIIVALLALTALSAQSIREVVTEEKTQGRVFVDDLGREVSLPSEITRIAPSGSNAQVIVFQIAPEKLVGLSTWLSDDEKTIYPEYTHDLPAFGTLYGKKANLNMEALILANPEVMIDVGDIKGSVADMAKELDDVSATVGVPVIFLEANMGNYGQVFRRLGDLLGYPERGEQLAQYYEKSVQEIGALVPETKPTVYITSSNDGLYAILAGKSHAECAEMAGAEVVVTSKIVQSNGNVSLETLYQLDPQYIFAYTKEGFDTIKTSEQWSTLGAVQNGRVYLVPDMPHGFIDQPVCSNRIIGLYYLASILYPQAGIDIVQKAKEYYSIFYRVELDDSAMADILHL